MTVYQATVKEPWLYLFSGRKTLPAGTPEVKDPFTEVHAIRLNAITGIRYEEHDHTVTIFANGHFYNIQCEFGHNLNAQLNGSSAFLCPILKALDIAFDIFWDFQCRTELTSRCRSRIEDLDETIVTLNATLEPHDVAEKGFKAVPTAEEKAVAETKAVLTAEPNADATNPGTEEATPVLS